MISGAKICVLGHAGIGKSKTIFKLHDQFLEQKNNKHINNSNHPIKNRVKQEYLNDEAERSWIYCPTDGCDVLEFDRVEVWDLAGDLIHPRIPEIYIKESVKCLIVCEALASSQERWINICEACGVSYIILEINDLEKKLKVLIEQYNRYING